MKKVLASVVVAMIMLSCVGTTRAVNDQRGGLMGFIAGCCFGIRAGMDYNDGKDIHWREWCRIVPFVDIVIVIWDGIDGANGTQRKDYIAQYGAAYY